MAEFSRPTIQPLVKTSDLKKAIVEKNKRLGESVEILKQEIKSLDSAKKEAEKDLHSAKADCEDAFNELESAGKELAAVKKKSLSAKKKLDERLIAEAISIGNCRKLESSISKLQSKSTGLASKIAYFLEEEKKYKSLSLSLRALNINIERSTDDLAKLKTSKSQFKQQTDAVAKRCNEMIKKHDEVKASLEEAKESFKAELKVIDKKLAITRSQCAKDISAIQDNVIDKNLKLDEIDSMIIKAESKYLSWEKKISTAKSKLKEEKDNLVVAKKNFDSWQVTALDELARLKLKGRLENIDKAGLKDVFSR